MELNIKVYTKPLQINLRLSRDIFLIKLFLVVGYIGSLFSTRRLINPLTSPAITSISYRHPKIVDKLYHRPKKEWSTSWSSLDNDVIYGRNKLTKLTVSQSLTVNTLYLTLQTRIYYINIYHGVVFLF